VTTIDKPYLDLTFAHKYLVEFLPELPGYPTLIHYFPGNSIEGGKDGLLLKFLPEDNPAWLGYFSFGFANSSDYTLSGVYSSPNVTYACVISNGGGYWVNANDPSDCLVLQLKPILHVSAAKEHALLILSSFTSIGLIGSDGILFKSQRLCWDDLRILNIEDGLISGTGSDPTNTNSDREFVFDIKSRKVLKSAYPFPE
jgi:hypothetical protein